MGQSEVAVHRPSLFIAAAMRMRNRRVMRVALLVLGAISIAAVASASQRGPDSLAVFDAQLLTTEGEPASLTRVCVRELTIYQEADSAFGENSSALGRVRGARFSGSDMTTAWMDTDAHGMLHIERPFVAPHALQADPRAHRRLIWTASIWAPGIGATPPTVWLLEQDKPRREAIKLLAAANVIGTVVDERGLPREGVSIEVSSEKPRVFNFKNWNLRTLTDSTGTFRFDGVVPATYGVTAWSNDGFQVVTDTHPDELTIASAAETRPTVLFVDDRTLRVHLVDEAGSPLPRSALNYQAWKRHGYTGSSIETDADGWFAFEFRRRFAPPMVHSGPPCLPRVVTLWVLNWQSDFAGSRARDDLLAGGAAFDLTQGLPSEIEITVRGTGALQFDVRDADGNSVRYAVVYFYHPGVASLGGPQPTQEQLEQHLDLPCSKGQDWPRVVGVPPGEYELYVRAAGSGAGAWATLSGETRISVQPGATVRLDPMSLHPNSK